MASIPARIREANAAGRGTRAGIEALKNRFNRRSWRVDVKDYGPASLRVRVGDADGSGEAPAVQIEIEHEFGCSAIALSGREADALINVLKRASDTITPRERFRARFRHLIQDEK